MPECKIDEAERAARHDSFRWGKERA
jgi:hypothetical protein